MLDPSQSCLHSTRLFDFDSKPPFTGLLIFDLLSLLVNINIISVTHQHAPTLNYGEDLESNKIFSNAGSKIGVCQTSCPEVA